MRDLSVGGLIIAIVGAIVGGLVLFVALPTGGSSTASLTSGQNQVAVGGSSEAPQGCSGDQKTGVGNTVSYKQNPSYRVDLPSGCVLLVEGVSVAVNGDSRSNGVFMALSEPGTYNLDIQDGEWVVRSPSFAQQDFCARVNRAIQEKDAYSNIIPLPGWAPC